MEMLPPDQEPLPIRESRAGERRPRKAGQVHRPAHQGPVLDSRRGSGRACSLLIVADVIGIKIFSKPVPGGIE